MVLNYPLHAPLVVEGFHECTDGVDKRVISAQAAGATRECRAALQSQQMPNTRVESFRFTDVSSILKSQIQVPAASQGAASSMLADHTLREDDELRAVIVDGCLDAGLSNLAGLPEGVFVGSVRDAPEDLVAMRLGAQATTKGTPFTQINGALAQDVVCIILPQGTEVSRPLHLLHIASGREELVSLNSPRLLIIQGQDSHLQILEEFVPLDSSHTCRYLTNATAEFELAESSTLQHGYANLEGGAAWHIKSTLVNQAARSHYALTEASLGGTLTRHDVVINQMGPETETIMRNLQVCGERQVHDLHSSLRLDHPAGSAKQLHKCIVASSTGRGVFDGNVQVNQKAQQTDAAQLSRNLLLAARGAVFARPNLQIIADDVSCTHGCTVSDLEDDQLFYFTTRGIGAEQARKILVYSFGKEITQGFRFPRLEARLESAVNELLSNVV
ncbi:hypothetical protein WJX84_012155 [Apatococcus fuscideae]|uniref:Fe-S cluster assembly protein SufD n=1 Tax=Apatococcus fuscideae TaxID=2026836 RepID=A0AAW1SVX3_9CHLO